MRFLWKRMPMSVQCRQYLFSFRYLAYLWTLVTKFALSWCLKNIFSTMILHDSSWFFLQIGLRMISSSEHPLIFEYQYLGKFFIEQQNIYWWITIIHEITTKSEETDEKILVQLLIRSWHRTCFEILLFDYFINEILKQLH